MKKLEIYGDSILKGVMYSADEGKYRLCRGSRSRSLDDVGIEVENKSRMGATIDRGLTSLKRSLDTIDGDTAVLLEFGGNDCDYDWAQISSDPHGTFASRTPERDFIEKYREAISAVKQRGARVIVSSLIPIDAQKYLNWISRGLDRSNILAWLGDVSMLYRWQEHYNRLVEQLCAEAGCELLDLRGRFLLDHNYDKLLCSDGIHPTQQGHDMIDRELRSFLCA